MESASLAGGKLEAMSGKKPRARSAMSAEASAEKQAHPEHGAREQLLGALAALLFPHPDQRGHERLIHGLGDEVDEQAGNERRGEKGIHGIGAAIDGGNADLLGSGDELDEDARCANGEDGAQDAAMDGGESAGRGDGRGGWHGAAFRNSAAPQMAGRERRSGAKA